LDPCSPIIIFLVVAQGEGGGGGGTRWSWEVRFGTRGRRRGRGFFEWRRGDQVVGVWDVCLWSMFRQDGEAGEDIDVYNESDGRGDPSRGDDVEG
jgi:hypothetical protein